MIYVSIYHGEEIFFKPLRIEKDGKLFDYCPSCVVHQSSLSGSYRILEFRKKIYGSEDLIPDKYKKINFEVHSVPYSESKEQLEDEIKKLSDCICNKLKLPVELAEQISENVRKNYIEYRKRWEALIHE